MRVNNDFSADYTDIYRVEKGDDTLDVEIDEVLLIARIENRFYRRLYVNAKSGISHFLYKGKKWYEPKLKIAG